MAVKNVFVINIKACFAKRIIIGYTLGNNRIMFYRTAEGGESLARRQIVTRKLALSETYLLSVIMDVFSLKR
jgi:hypothetical protein